MKNYSGMSDFEINCLVAKHFGEHVFLNIFKEPVRLEADPAATYTGKDFDEVAFDPCNSWADAGPIIHEQKISINAHGLHAWMAWINKGENIQQIISGRYSYSHINENPLRCAMIVFLMMQEGV